MISYQQLRSVAVRVRKNLDPSGQSTLRGWCFTATEDMAHDLIDLGADDVTVLENFRHSFLYCSRYFIDVTCRQFNPLLPAVKMWKIDSFDWEAAPPYWQFDRIEAIYLDGTRKRMSYNHNDHLRSSNQRSLKWRHRRLKSNDAMKKL